MDNPGWSCAGTCSRCSCPQNRGSHERCGQALRRCNTSLHQRRLPSQGTRGQYDQTGCSGSMTWRSRRGSLSAHVRACHSCNMLLYNTSYTLVKLAFIKHHMLSIHSEQSHQPEMLAWMWTKSIQNQNVPVEIVENSLNGFSH